ncbi:tyrosine recombinase XerC [Myceligenerans pegani]|uniref:Tyrosine-type recombinase/integrase family protein n=1 Tax=Myceligenerans pegani TaxID=2776917 RepID=A0ABR9N438_9MICO|nr:site-specific integrase [Myceligenerans sp. TRM 65318]MBE1877838.1 tyrosine-type recombinase/integrase family protein [Myceligenerans sp. TRM 65318]MBE3020109.1 tyrosine-type recombinase/integrase family protein [Myceligenerans sp. TRM 65318]
MSENEKPRRARGEGGLRWQASKNLWIAEKTVGYRADNGKRIVKTGTGKTRTAASNSLREKIREYEAGLLADSRRVTVAQVCKDWLDHGRGDVGPKTKEGNEDNYLNHIEPHLGKRKLADLRHDEVDDWLEKLAPNLSTSSLKQVRSVLKRSIDRAIKRGLAERNVVDLCVAPKGRDGRRSKSLTLEQASAVLANTKDHKMHAYIVVGLLTGVRVEEQRVLTWDRVQLDTVGGQPPHIEVWRADRLGGDTKTPKSRRTLGISGYAATVLRKHRDDQDEARRRAGERWKEANLVFPSEVGTVQDAHNVLRMFRDALRLVPGIDPEDWVTRELRPSFVSILSRHGLPIEEISRLMGHSGTAVTELVYRHELRPVLETGATVMDDVFGHLDGGKSGDDEAA